MRSIRLRCSCLLRPCRSFEVDRGLSSPWFANATRALVLAAPRQPPRREVARRLLVGGRIESDDRAPLHHFLGDEVLERRHLDGLVGNLGGQMRRNDDDTLASPTMT